MTRAVILPLAVILAVTVLSLTVILPMALASLAQTLPALARIAAG
jgi:hypothetical protein